MDSDSEELKCNPHEKFSLMLLERLELVEAQHSKKVSLDARLSEVDLKLSRLEDWLGSADRMWASLAYMRWACGFVGAVFDKGFVTLALLAVAGSYVTVHGPRHLSSFSLFVAALSVSGLIGLDLARQGLPR